MAKYLLYCLMGMLLVSMTTDMSVRSDDVDSCGGVTYDETCPTDCSQSARRYKHDNDVFNCSIGTQKDVSHFMLNNKYVLDTLAKCAAPTMIGVDFYMKNYNNPSLNISFLLPEGKKNMKNDYDYPIAVLMTFQSVGDPTVQDRFYYRCHRKRIFEFHDWQPSTTYDSKNPRKISYNCLVGLNNSASTRVYLINLASLPGHNITYTITVFPLNHSAENQTWKPAIGTSVDVKQRSIFVVFEVAPELYNRRYYQLYLIDSAGHIVNRTGKLQTVTYTFDKVKHGKYRITVAVYGRGSKCKGQCVNGTSTYIDALAIPADDFPIHYPVEASLLKLIAMGCGCFVGLMTVMFLLYMFRCRHKHGQPPSPESTPSGLIIHSHHYNPKYRSVVNKLGHFLQNICDVPIHIDVWHEHFISELTVSLKNSSTFQTDSERQPVTSAIHKWVEHKLETVTFVIIICAPGQMDFKTSDLSTKYFQTFLEMATERSKSKNNLWIMPVLFTTYASSADVPGLVSGKPVCHLMKDIDKIYCKIQGVDDIPDDKKPYLRTNSYMIKSKEGKELFDAINKTRRENTCTKTGTSELKTNLKSNLPDQINNEILDFNCLLPKTKDCGKLPKKQTDKATEDRFPASLVADRQRHYSEGSKFHRFNAEVHHSADLDPIAVNQDSGNHDQRGYVSMPTEPCQEWVRPEEKCKHNLIHQLNDVQCTNCPVRYTPHPITNTKSKITAEFQSRHDADIPYINGHHDYRGQHTGPSSIGLSVRKEVGDYMNENQDHIFAQCDHKSMFPNHHGDGIFRNQCENHGNEYEDFAYGGKIHTNNNFERGFAPCEFSDIVPQTAADYNHQAGLDMITRDHISPLDPICQGRANHVGDHSKYINPGHCTNGNLDSDMVGYPTHDTNYACTGSHKYYVPGEGHCSAAYRHRNTSENYDYPETNDSRDVYEKDDSHQICPTHKTKIKTKLPTVFPAVDPPPVKVNVTDNKQEMNDSGIQSGETEPLLNSETCKETVEGLEKHSTESSARRRSLCFEPLLDNSPDNMFIPPDDLDFAYLSEGSDTSSVIDKMARINNQH